MIARLSILWLITLASAGVAEAQFHRTLVDPKEHRDTVVQKAVDEYELLIDFLMRSEDLEARQVDILRIAAKGVGEHRAAQFVTDYSASDGPPADPFAPAVAEADRIWDQAVSRILSAEQLVRFNEAKAIRSKWAEASLIDRLDRILYLDAEQKSKLTKLLPRKDRMSDLHQVFPAEIGGTDKAEVRKILSTVQMKTWEAIMQGRFDTPAPPFDPFAAP